MNTPAGYVCFDLDGCLWDSDRSHFEAVNLALAPYGERITEQEHQTTFKGLPTQQKLQMLTAMGRLSLSAHDDVAQRKRKVTFLTIKSVQPRPDATTLLLALRNVGWRICCCSNSIRSTVQEVLLQMGILEYMDFLLSNEDVVHAKPSPEMYEKAARIWHVPPTRMIVVEDGEAGKLAALRAGCQLIDIAGPADVEPWLLHRILEVGRVIIQTQEESECMSQREVRCGR